MLSSFSLMGKASGFPWRDVDDFTKEWLRTMSMQLEFYASHWSAAASASMVSDTDTAVRLLVRWLSMRVVLLHSLATKC